MAAKKAATKKVAKKATAKKTTTKTPKATKSKVELVSFEVAAVIPTQQYGNIQPKIVVTAPTIEEAKEVVMPMIEELYTTYAELPLNGKPVKFAGKVTVEEKKVEAPAPAPAPKAGTPATESSPAPSAPSSSPSAPAAPTAPTAPAGPAPAPAPAAPAVDTVPEPVIKARKAISLSTSKEALALVRNQIENSVKIDPSFKPDLIKLCDEKLKELDPAF